MRDPAELVRAAHAGDQDAWDELVERYTGLLWAVARGHRLNSADAAEVVQTTWLRLVEHLDQLRDPAHVGAWLYTTARHECLRTLRLNGRQVPVAEVEPTLDRRPAEPGPESLALDGDRDRQLWSALDAMPDRCRKLLRVLMAEPAPSYEDVSLAMRMPIGSIGPTRARCLGKLRKDVAAMGITAEALRS